MILKGNFKVKKGSKNCEVELEDLPNAYIQDRIGDLKIIDVILVLFMSKLLKAMNLKILKKGL